MDPVSAVAGGGAVVTALGVLSKPACLLIEKFSAATGVLYEPTRIIRKAEAEAEGMIIKSAAQLYIEDETQRRVFDRMLQSESKKHQNVDKILEGAIHDLKPDADASKLENDWVANFVAKCENVSDPQMASLWSRILSGQTNAPGSFSRKTIDLVSTLEKADAELFTKLCGYSLSFTIANKFVPYIFEPSDSIYTERGITFTSLLHLSEMGLIQFQTGNNRFSRQFSDGWNGLIGYFDEVLLKEIIAGNSSSLVVDNGVVILSKSGEQLAPICGASKVDGFSDYIVAHTSWRRLDNFRFTEDWKVAER